MIKIHKLFNSPHGTREKLDLTLESDAFPDQTVLGPVSVSGELLRIEEGIVFHLRHLDATLEMLCVACGKTLKVKINSPGSEWMFHQNKPLHFDPADEALMIDSKHYTIDLVEPVRQEIILNTPDYPRCKQVCRKEIPEEKGVKALKGLTEIMLGAKFGK